MLETGNSRIDIEALERKIKWDARKYRWIWLEEKSPAAFDIPPILKEENIAEEHSLAAQSLANVEAPHYTLQRFPGLLRWPAAIAAKAVLYLSSIITHAQTQFNYHVVQGLSVLDRRFSRTREEVAVLAQMTSYMEEVIQQLDGQVSALEQRVESAEKRLTQGESERFDHGQELESFRSRLPIVEEQLREDLPPIRESLKTAKSGLAQQSARLSAQERVLSQVKQSQSSAASENTGLGNPGAANSSGELDGLYMVFEDQFRGAQEEVVARLQEYLPLVEACLDGQGQHSTALDLGCGRGEWLRLLTAQGIGARGVDTSPGFVGQCLQAGLDVIEQEALAYLSTVEDDSIDIVTGFHIIEHMEFALMVRLVDESLRVLRPGGMVIFETPNPKNLIVGACNFYADPTHVRQLFPELLEFVLQGRGFQSVALRYLNPHPEAQRLAEEEAPILAGQLNNLLSCARDFAVIGYK